MKALGLFRFYWFALGSTLLIWLLTFLFGGIAALLTVFILTLLEITFSADNAVVNSKILTTLSPFWQKLFLTVGIIIAVFAVRFILPVFIVMVSAGIGFNDVLHLALYEPSTYGDLLHHAAPAINAFGGTFLLLIALSYFIDHEKSTHWLHWLEHRLGKLGRYDNITLFAMLLVAVGLYLTTDPAHHEAVLLASVCAIALHAGLDLLDTMLATGKKQSSKVVKTGVAAFIAFMYLQVLDASFSLDGVIGAFAITNDVLLIMAGLGAGAVWVRSMTIHMVKAKALNTYIYLEHGAHWAIGFLGAVMLLDLYHVKLPEWFVGSLGLIFIVLAITWSRKHTTRIEQSA